MMLENVLLSGLVGSKAYGLNRPESDEDHAGIFAATTTRFLGLHPLLDKDASVVTVKPDSVYQEAGKYCRLALKGNPSVTELLWLPDELYQVRTPLGNDLIKLRSAFLSAARIKDAYLGYAFQQFNRLKRREDGSFSSDTRKQTAKHARHLLRLLHQGLELYTMGKLTVHVGDPEPYFIFGEAVVADPDHALPILRDFEVQFAARSTMLPREPDEAKVENWLQRVREAYTPR